MPDRYPIGPRCYRTGMPPEPYTVPERGPVESRNKMNGSTGVIDIAKPTPSGSEEKACGSRAGRSLHQ